jgi:hypothetical protein
LTTLKGSEAACAELQIKAAATRLANTLVFIAFIAFIGNFQLVKEKKAKRDLEAPRLACACVVVG